MTSDGIPPVTRHELQRLGPTGIDRIPGHPQVIVVGRAAHPRVLTELDAMGLKATTITAPTLFELANSVDRFYGAVQNPDLGVATMETSASTGGNGVMDVLIGAPHALPFLLPATHWVSHMPAGLLWVTEEQIPSSTVEALERRQGRAIMYVFGGPREISPRVVQKLSRFGQVTRVTNNDNMAFNHPPVDTPMTTSIAFAKMWDPVGMVGWNITGPGHGFTLVREEASLEAVASAILSHLGFHAPLLLTPRGDGVPSELEDYYALVAPTFLNTPAQGPYNMHYVVADYRQISWSA